MKSEPAIIHVVGNRPQFIKLAVLHKAIRDNTGLRQIIIHTGQHSSPLMSDIFFKELGIPTPEISLMIEADTPDTFIGQAASQLYSVFAAQKTRDIVLVYGDTNSTLAAAMAAKRGRHRLFHFESGVRTQDASMPEEINRILTDRLSDVHYCCTQKNVDTLIREGYGQAIEAEVIRTGDLMLDAFKTFQMAGVSPVGRTGYVACTIHRAGNILNRKRLSEIVKALNYIHKDVEVIIPLHPHTAKRLREFQLTLDCTVTEPVGYLQMKRFIADSAFVITDSGGAGREAFFSQKKSLVIMSSPFWPEIIEAGAAVNCDPDYNRIVAGYQQISSLTPQFDLPIFGDGDAAGKIARHLNSITSER